MSDKEIKTVFSIEAKLDQGFTSLDKQLKSIGASLKALSNLKDFNKFNSILSKSATASGELAKNLAMAAVAAKAIAAAGASGTFIIGGGGGGKGGGGGGGGGGASAAAAANSPGTKAPKTPPPPPRPFLQGAIQGAGGPQFLGRKNALRQTAGFLTGRMAAGVGNLGSAVFTGSAGVSRALGGVPFIGGGLAATFGGLDRAASDAYGLRTDVSSTFASTGTPDELMLPTTPSRRKIAYDSAFNDTVGVLQQRATMRQEGRLPAGDTNIYDPTTGQRISPAEFRRTLDQNIRGQQRSRMTAFYDENRDAFSTLQLQRETEFLDNIRGTSTSLGVDVQAGTRTARAALSRSGYSALGSEGLDLARTAIGAGRLGVDAELTGQLGYGVRSGGFSERQRPDNERYREGSTEMVIRQGLAQAVELGLRGADVPALLKELGRNISDFRQSGLRVNESALGDAAMGFRRLGAAPETSLSLGGALMGAGKRIGESGPDGLDFKFLRYFGGLDTQGPISPDQLENARIAAEKGTFMNAANVERFFADTVQGAGGGAAGRQLAQAEFSSMTGGRMSAELSKRIGTMAMGGTLTDAEMTAMKTDADRADAMRNVPVDLLARGAVSSAEVDTAGQRNRQLIDAGIPLIETFKNLAATQVEAQASMAQFATDIESLSGLIREASETFSSFVRSLRAPDAPRISASSMQEPSDAPTTF